MNATIDCKLIWEGFVDHFKTVRVSYRKPQDLVLYVITALLFLGVIVSAAIPL
ncbi:MAG: hypothetical protein KDD43_03455 [Bdellovibrionales bacterium]|nr:hypothetical protein [Bdellovibrionales bacterium]